MDKEIKKLIFIVLLFINFVKAENNLNAIFKYPDKECYNVYLCLIIKDNELCFRRIQPDNEVQWIYYDFHIKIRDENITKLINGYIVELTSDANSYEVRWYLTKIILLIDYTSFEPSVIKLKPINIKLPKIIEYYYKDFLNNELEKY